MKIYKIANSVYHSGDYGSWIYPDGGIHRVLDQEGHIEVLYDIFRHEGIDDDLFDKDELANKFSYETAYKTGFVRVINLPLSFDFRIKLTEEQKITMMSLVMEYRGIDVYIQQKFDNMKRFNKELDIDAIDKLIQRS